MDTDQLKREIEAAIIKGSTIPPQESRKVWFGIGIAFLIVLGINYWIAISFDPKNPGQFGDMFGAGNAIFSGLALLGVVYSMIQQRKELQLQREDLHLQKQVTYLSLIEAEKTAQAQKGAQNALIEQTITMQEQVSATYDQIGQMDKNYNSQLLKLRVDAYATLINSESGMDRMGKDELLDIRKNIRALIGKLERQSGIKNNRY